MLFRSKYQRINEQWQIASAGSTIHCACRWPIARLHSTARCVTTGLQGCASIFGVNVATSFPLWATTTITAIDPEKNSEFCVRVGLLAYWHNRRLEALAQPVIWTMWIYANRLTVAGRLKNAANWMSSHAMKLGLCENLSFSYRIDRLSIEFIHRVPEKVGLSHFYFRHTRVDPYR